MVLPTRRKEVSTLIPLKPLQVSSGGLLRPGSPRLVSWRAIFYSRSCSSCHGISGQDLLALTACIGALRGSWHGKSSLLLSRCTCRPMYAGEALNDDVRLAVLITKHLTNPQLPSAKQISYLCNVHPVLTQCSSNVHHIFIHWIPISSTANSPPPFPSDPSNHQIPLMFCALFCSSWSITSSSSRSPKRSKSSSLWPWSRPRNPRRSSKSCWCRSFLSGTVALVRTSHRCSSCESQLGPWWVWWFWFVVSEMGAPLVGWTLWNSPTENRNAGSWGKASTSRRCCWSLSWCRNSAVQLLIWQVFAAISLSSIVISKSIHPRTWKGRKESTEYTPAYRKQQPHTF